MKAANLIDRIFPKETRTAYLGVYILTSALVALMATTGMLLGKTQRLAAGVVTAIFMLALFFLVYKRPDFLTRHERLIRRICHVVSLIAIVLITISSYRKSGELVRSILLSLTPFVMMFVLSKFLIWVYQSGHRSVERSLHDRHRASGKIFELSGFVVTQMMSPKRRSIFLVVQFVYFAIVLYVCAYLFTSHQTFQAILLIVSSVVAIQLIEWILYAEVLERKSVETELQAAHNLQMSLMPVSDPDIPGFDISGLCQPAEEVGGDYYDYLWLDEAHTKLGIAVADVSGKAMQAAMTAVMTSGMVYREVEAGSSPKEILTRINKPMYLKTTRMAFTALVFAVIDIPNRTLTVSNAGQAHPLLLRNGSVSEIRSPGNHLPLGAADRIAYEQETVRLLPEDTVLVFTDGLTESMNEKDQLFGFERLTAAVLGLARQAPARECVLALTNAARTFSGRAKQHDDMTLVVIKVLP